MSWNAGKLFKVKYDVFYEAFSAATARAEAIQSFILHREGEAIHHDKYSSNSCNFVPQFLNPKIHLQVPDCRRTHIMRESKRSKQEIEDRDRAAAKKHSVYFWGFSRSNQKMNIEQNIYKKKKKNTSDKRGDVHA